MLLLITILIDLRSSCFGKFGGKWGDTSCSHVFMASMLCVVSMLVYIDTASLVPSRSGVAGKLVVGAVVGVCPNLLRMKG